MVKQSVQDRNTIELGSVVKRRAAASIEDVDGYCPIPCVGK